MLLQPRLRRCGFCRRVGRFHHQDSVRPSSMRVTPMPSIASMWGCFAQSGRVSTVMPTLRVSLTSAFAFASSKVSGGFASYCIQATLDKPCLVLHRRSWKSAAHHNQLNLIHFMPNSRKLANAALHLLVWVKAVLASTQCSGFKSCVALR